jgi:Tol biopolymer transport system component
MLKGMIPALASIPVALGLAACQDVTDPSHPLREPIPQFVVADGAHGGNSRFYFLPPLVPKPQYNGTFDPTLHPLAKLCRLPACASDLFTFAAGPGRGEIEVQNDAYRLHWQTRSSGLVTGARYRIRVYVGPQLLGYLDFQVLEKQGRPTPLPSGLVGLRKGHPLLLRFRIEQGAVQQHGNRIAFVSTRDGNQEIYVMNVDGTQERRLTDGPNYDGDATWSPDGGKIAFLSYRNGANDIYVMNADGTGLKNLTQAIGTINNAQPAWSPDGRTIAFYGQQSGTNGIWVMRSDGTMPRRLTSEGEHLPTWSPDGTKLAIRWQGMVPVPGGSRSESRIIVMNADGTSPHPILNTFVACPGYMDWSPDGQRIAFDECFGASTISFISPGGTQLSHLNLGGNHSQHPSWSPDGSRIAFWHSNDAEGVISDIYTMRNDGTDRLRLTDHPAFDFDPAWSP